MTKPIEADPSRSGDPLFMDDKLLAFRASWKDLKRYDEAMLSLMEIFRSGIGGDGKIATPVAMRAAWL